MNNNVANRDFKHWKALCLRCLNENREITEKLYKNYKLIQVYFFNEATDPNVETILREILVDPSIRHSAEPIPATTYSRKNVGCIVIFLKHYKDVTQKRTDIEDFESYLKNGLFEELCHLVEQKGDSSIHPSSYGIMWMLYRNRNLLDYGNEIRYPRY